MPQQQILQIQSPRSGKVYNMQWDKPTPPTDADFAKFIDDVDPLPQPPSASERFWGPQIAGLNPINIVTGAVQAVSNPWGTVQNIFSQMGDQWGKAGQSFNRMQSADSMGGAAAEALRTVRHAIGGSVPILGPQFGQAGEMIDQGDIAGGTGHALAGFESLMLGGPASAGLRRAADITRLNRLAPLAVETGMGMSRTIRDKFGGGGFGREMLDRNLIGTRGSVGAELGRIEQQNVVGPARAYDAANPPNIDVLNEMIIPSINYAEREGMINSLSAPFRVPRQNQLADLSDAHLNDSFNNMPVMDALNQYRASARQGGGMWRDMSESERTAALYTEGNAMAARDAVTRRLPEIDNALRSERRLLGAQEAMEHAYSSPSMLRWGMDLAPMALGMTTGHWGAGLLGSGVMFGTRNPLAMSIIGHGLDKTGQATSHPLAIQSAIANSLAQQQQQQEQMKLMGVLKGVRR